MLNFFFDIMSYEKFVLYMAKYLARNPNAETTQEDGEGATAAAGEWSTLSIGPLIHIWFMYYNIVGQVTIWL